MASIRMTLSGRPELTIFSRRTRFAQTKLFFAARDCRMQNFRAIRLELRETTIRSSSRLLMH